MKKGRLLFVCLSLLSVFKLSSCTYTNVREEKTIIGEEKEISLNLSQTIETIKFNKLIMSNLDDDSIIELNITQSSLNKINCTYCEGLDEYDFKINQKGNDLIISTNKDYNYKVTTFKLNLFIDSENINIFTDGMLNVNIGEGAYNTFSFETNGKSNFKLLDCSCSKIKIKANGTMNAYLRGLTEELLCQINGLCNIDAKEMICKRVDASINGCSSIEVSVTDTLRVSVDGLGRISYYGNPSIDNKFSGEGSITQVSTEVYSK